jgi:predicted TPR repeat methyltransferase
MTSASDIRTSTSPSDVGKAASADTLRPPDKLAGEGAAEAAEPSYLELVHADRPDDAVTELDLNEAIALAAALQQRGFVDAAQQLCERILAIEPAHPDALHFSGLLLHRKGDSAGGLERVRQALALRPGAALIWNNLGNILLTLNRYDEAGEAYERSASLAPEDADLLNNLGVLRRAQGRHAEAEAALRRAIALRPQFVDAYNNLGHLLHARGEWPEAVDLYMRAFTFAPQNRETRKLLAIAYQRLGEHDKAEQIYRAWIEEEPDNPLPRHYLSACTGIDVPTRAPDAFVETTFDHFAATFDSRLEGLFYRAPELLGDVVAWIYGEPKKSLEVLDAGCGTGLCGPLLAPYARRLIGVDLSAEMLARARSRSLYDALHKAELTAFLASAREEYDLIVSADTLCYFGALTEIAAGACCALRPGGYLAFTVEALDEAEASAGHRLEGHARYAHARGYIHSTFTTAGFVDLQAEEAHLRIEGGRPVRGFVVSCRRPSKDKGS